MSRTLKERFETDVNVERTKEILENLLRNQNEKSSFHNSKK